MSKLFKLMTIIGIIRDLLGRGRRHGYHNAGHGWQRGNYRPYGPRRHGGPRSSIAERVLRRVLRGRGR